MKILKLMRACAVFVVAAQLCAGVASAQATYSTGFESPGFTLGDVNGQQGWGHISNSPTKGIVEATPGGSPAAFGSQLLALRTRNVDFFGVSNHLFSATIDPAGEAGSTVGGAAVTLPRNHFAASFYYRTPATPVTSTRADGRFAELNPSSRGAGAEDPANRYAQVRVVNVNNTGNLRFEIGWYTSTALTFCVQTVAQNLTWGAWYRLDYDLLFFADTAGTNAGAGRRLGAPGPQNISSPVERAATLTPSLIDPSQPAASPPNRVRNHTSDVPNNSALGTLSVRRRYTNNTGLPVTRLRFRVIDITTYPSAGLADMRARTSADEVVTLTGGATTLVRGTTLETPPAQPAAGGFNSTLSVGAVTLAAPLAPGATIDLQLTLGVQQTGNFRFYVKVEGLP